MTQVPLPGIVPFEKLRLVAPAPGAHVGVPQPTDAAAGVEATVMPEGNESVKFTPVSGAGLGFGIVNVRLEVWPGLMVLGENALVIVNVAGSRIHPWRIE